MKINLSDGEWKLMNKLWEPSPLTITQLTARLQEETGWGKHTVITMLSRLEAKGAVAHDGGTPKQYAPLIPRQEAQRGETESFLDRVYGGHLGSLVNAMVDSRSLTQADIDELAAILERAKGGGEDA